MKLEDYQARLLELGIEEGKEYSLAEIENVFLENRDVYICADIQPHFSLQIYHLEDTEDNSGCHAILIIGEQDKDDQICFHGAESIDSEGDMYDGYTYETLINALRLDKSQHIWSVLVDSGIV